VPLLLEKLALSCCWCCGADFMLELALRCAELCCFWAAAGLACAELELRLR
jgi:hypothetical protein